MIARRRFRARLALTLALLGTLTTLSTRASGQDVSRIVDILKNKPPKKKAGAREDAPTPVTPGKPIYVLRDNSQVTGDLGHPTVRIRTKFGVLAIPSDEILRIRFARRVPKAVRENATKFVRDLAAEDFEVREGAMAGLRELGTPAIELIREATRSSDPEVGVRAEVLLEELEEIAKAESNPEAAPGLEGTEDEIRSKRMVLKGEILTEAFTIATRYGSLRIDVADLNMIRFQATGAAKKNVDVTPGFQPPNNWLDTKIDVRKKQAIDIRASGTCNVSNWGLSSGPDGTNRYRNNTFGNFQTLALIGKIGKNGKSFKVGSKLKTKSKAEGRLYLSIIPFQYSPQSVQGRYRAKIKSGALQ